MEICGIQMEGESRGIWIGLPLQLNFDIGNEWNLLCSSLTLDRYARGDNKSIYITGNVKSVHMKFTSCVTR